MSLLALLETFVSIVDAGSVSGAARALGISAAMASRRLRALEIEVGAELMVRSTRKLAMTEAGTEILGRARRLILSSDDIRYVVRQTTDVRGSLTVSMPVALGISAISPALPGLLKQFPRLRLSIRFEDRPVDQIAENIDVVIRAGIPPPDSTELIARRLITFERVLCAAPEFLARCGHLEKVEDLASVSCLVQGNGAGHWRFRENDLTKSVAVDGPLRSLNVLSIREAACAGLGVALVPLRFVLDDIRSGRLVQLLPHVRAMEGALFGIYHARMRHSPTINTILEHIQLAIGPAPRIADI